MMSAAKIKKIVILGGGTAGWMTAAALSRFMDSARTRIVLVESDAIGTVGVGEATIPHIRVFNDMLGIPEHEFMQAAQATYKLGIRFDGWGDNSSSYYHPFGDHGFSINNVAFHHYWLAAKARGEVVNFDHLSMANVMAMNERFIYPLVDPENVESTYSFAYHLDASAYAKFLRARSEALGVERIEGEVLAVDKDNASGNILSLKLKDGREIAGDLFVDCSGFRSRLLGAELGVAYESWKDWLPCDRAVALPSELNGNPVPYTRSIAKQAGWCWQIPLQHRMGNGHVYCSDYMSEECALEILTEQLSGAQLASPRHIRFEAGMRTHSWEKNCVAIGLSSGFLEPLESTSIYLIQVGIFKLLELIPAEADYSLDAKEYNRYIKNEYEKVRDFIILHYWLNRRDEPFWQRCASMDLPDSLKYKIEVFKESACVVEYDAGLFMSPSWLAVYFGQGLYPKQIDSRVVDIPKQQLDNMFLKMSSHLHKVAKAMPSHAESLKNSGLPSTPGVPKLSLYGVRR
jgi:tryptophan halogenase